MLVGCGEPKKASDKPAANAEVSAVIKELKATPPAERNDFMRKNAWRTVNLTPEESNQIKALLAEAPAGSSSAGGGSAPGTPSPTSNAPDAMQGN